MKKNVLLIGSNGFLGSHVKNLLNKEKIKFSEIKGKNQVDITNYTDFNNFVSKDTFDTIINCAAFVGGISFGYKYQADLLKINSLIGLNIYSVAKENNINHIINPISNCVYPGKLRIYNEVDFWNGPPHESVFNYALSKRLIVGLAESFFKQYGISSSNVVMSNMYGPLDHFDEARSHAMGAIIKKVSDAKNNNKKTVEIWGTGKPIREWLYVEDGAKALIKSLKLKKGCYLFNVGSNKGSSIFEISKIIADAFNWDGDFVFNTNMPDGVMRKTVNGDYGKELLNWSPEVKLIDGINKTVEWYINEFK